MIERLAYEPFGKRRFASGSDDPNNTIVPQNTDRGYTNHEHLDELTLVHMNGRVYDPVVGRFMSADLQIQDPMNLQSYNRYAYVMNNPLFYIDPTGYSFWTKLRDYVIKPAIAIAVAVYAPEISAFIGWTGGVSATGMAIAGGGSLALGITSGAVASGVLGGALAGAIMGGDLRSAVIGGISGGAFGWAGDIGQANGLYGAEHFAAHAAAGCLRGELGGGGCGRGAVSGMAGLEGGRYGFIGAIVAGGTVSVIGGGKFGNGAITGAFGYLFNYCAHNGRFDRPFGLAEAADQWRNGNGATVTDVKASELNLTDATYVKNADGSYQIHTSIKTMTGAVYGTVTGILDVNGTMSIKPDYYNFDMKNPLNGGTLQEAGRLIVRDALTLAGHAINGPGTAYRIEFSGAIPAPKNLPR